MSEPIILQVPANCLDLIDQIESIREGHKAQAEALEREYQEKMNKLAEQSTERNKFIWKELQERMDVDLSDERWQITLAYRKFGQVYLKLEPEPKGLELIGALLGG